MNSLPKPQLCDRRLDVYAASAKTGPLAAELSAHAETCAGCREILALDAQSLPPMPIVSVQPAQEQAPLSLDWRRWGLGLGAAGVAAVLLVAVMARTPGSAPAPGTVPAQAADLRMKGDSVTSIARLRNGQTEALVGSPCVGDDLLLTLPLARSAFISLWDFEAAAVISPSVRHPAGVQRLPALRVTPGPIDLAVVVSPASPTAAELAEWTRHGAPPGVALEQIHLEAVACD